MKNSLRKMLCLLLTMIMLVGCCTTFSFAAGGTKTMTAYKECIKKGNTVYCICNEGLYRVNLKNGKRTVLFRVENIDNDELVGMKLYKGYIYFVHVGCNYDTTIYRIKAKGTSRKRLATYYSDYDEHVDFAISGKKIYYKGYYNYCCTRSFRNCMKLNGSKKTKTTLNVKTKYKKSNVKGYSIVEKEKRVHGDDAIVYYLKKPNGKLLYLDIEYLQG